MGETWISDVLEVEFEADCVRAVLASGNERITLRGSRKNLVKFMGLGAAALRQKRRVAAVVSLPKHS